MAAKKATPTAALAKPAKAATPVPKAAAKPAAAAKAVVVTVTMKQLGIQLAEKHGMARKDVDGLLSGMVEMFTDHLKQGDRLRIGGLGILEVKSRAARMGRNPATGAAIEIKASKKIAFRAAKELKEAV